MACDWFKRNTIPFIACRRKRSRRHLPMSWEEFNQILARTDEVWQPYTTLINVLFVRYPSKALLSANSVLERTL
jgi:hypothetical protein